MNNKIYYFIVSIILLSIIIFKDDIYFLINKNSIKQWQNVNEYYDSEIKENYENLLSITEITLNKNYNYIYSKVLYRDIYSFKKEVTILKGKDFNLAKNMPIINEYGLIGIISEVLDNTSVVKLITNPSLNISVKIGDSYGLLCFKNNNIMVTNIVKQGDIKENDIIYTSGLGSLPANIFIGYVDKIVDLGMEKNVIVNSLVNFNKINFVIIIKDVK